MSGRTHPEIREFILTGAVGDRLLLTPRSRAAAVGTYQNHRPVAWRRGLDLTLATTAGSSDQYLVLLAGDA